MSNEPSGTGQTKPARREGMFNTILSLLALAVSGISLYFSYVISADVANVDAIKSEYALFTNLSRLQYEHPLMSHLFAVTAEQYRMAKDQIASVAAASNAEKRTTSRLEELGIANSIFTSFEETFYYRRQAEQAKDSARMRLLDGDLDYFNQLICNPRLAWYWDPNKGLRLALQFAGDLQTYVAEQKARNPCVPAPDTTGPFG